MFAFSPGFGFAKFPGASLASKCSCIHLVALNVDVSNKKLVQGSEQIFECWVQVFIQALFEIWRNNTSQAWNYHISFSLSETWRVHGGKMSLPDPQNSTSFRGFRHRFLYRTTRKSESILETFYIYYFFGSQYLLLYKVLFDQCREWSCSLD